MYNINQLFIKSFPPDENVQLFQLFFLVNKNPKDWPTATGYAATKPANHSGFVIDLHLFDPPLMEDIHKSTCESLTNRDYHRLSA